MARPRAVVWTLEGLVSIFLALALELSSVSLPVVPVYAGLRFPKPSVV